jgi:hypothetical protein
MFDAKLTVLDFATYETVARSVELHSNSAVEQWYGYRPGQHVARDLSYGMSLYTRCM